MAVVQEKFGAYDYKHAIDKMLELKQTGSVDDYVTDFESLQYEISLHDLGMSDTHFISQFMKGLKPEIRFAVQGQVPYSMERAVMLAKIQEQIQEKNKSKFIKPAYPPRYNTVVVSKSDQKGIGDILSYPKRGSSEITAGPITCVSFAKNPMMLLMQLNVPSDQFDLLIISTH